MMISAHAIVRYLERVANVDVDDLRRRLRPPALAGELSDSALVNLIEQETPDAIAAIRRHLEGLCAEAISAGATSLARDGVVYIFKRSALVTVTPSHSKRPTKVRRGRVTPRARQDDLRCGVAE